MEKIANEFDFEDDPRVLRAVKPMTPRSSEPKMAKLRAPGSVEPKLMKPKAPGSVEPRLVKPRTPGSVEPMIPRPSKPKASGPQGRSSVQSRISVPWDRNVDSGPSFTELMMPLPADDSVLPDFISTNFPRLLGSFSENEFLMKKEENENLSKSPIVSSLGNRGEIGKNDFCSTSKKSFLTLEKCESQGGKVPGAIKNRNPEYEMPMTTRKVKEVQVRSKWSN